MTTAAQKIIIFLIAADRPLSPLEIARNMKLKPNVVRARLSELRRRGDVRREYRGHYVCHPTYDVARVPPRIQNLRVTASGIPVSISDSIILIEGDLGIRITFGKKRGKISYTVKASRGLDFYGFKLSHRLVNLLCESRGYYGLHWEVSNFEFLWDYESVRLEGCQCVTWSDLEGTLEKYYNKGDALRREIRDSEPRNIQDLEALIQGGVTANTVLQGLNVLRHEISSLVDAVKGYHYSYIETSKWLRESHASFIRLIDKIDKMMR